MAAVKTLEELVAQATKASTELSKKITENKVTDEILQAVEDLIKDKYPFLSSDQGRFRGEAIDSERSQPPKLSDPVLDGIQGLFNATKALLDHVHELGYRNFDSPLQSMPPAKSSNDVQQPQPKKRRVACEPTTRDSAADLAPEESAEGSNAEKRAQAIEGANVNTQTTSPENDPENDPSLIEAFASQHKLLTEAAQERDKNKKRDGGQRTFSIDDAVTMNLTGTFIERLTEWFSRAERERDEVDHNVDIDQLEDDELLHQEDLTGEEHLSDPEDWAHDSKCASEIRHRVEVELAWEMRMSETVPSSGTALPQLRDLFSNRFGMEREKDRAEVNIQSASALLFHWRRIAARIQKYANSRKARDLDFDTVSFDETSEESSGPDIESDNTPLKSSFEDMCEVSYNEEVQRVEENFKCIGDGAAKNELKAVLEGEGLWDNQEDVIHVNLEKASLDAICQVQDILRRHLPSFTFVSVVADGDEEIMATS